MSWTWNVLHEKRWRLAHIQQENVHVAVISYISKSAVAFVPEQKQWLPISRAVIHDRVHLRIDVAAGHKHVGPTIVIKVHETRAPLDIGVHRLTHLRTPTEFDESLSRSLVAI